MRSDVTIAVPLDSIFYEEFFDFFVPIFGVEDMNLCACGMIGFAEI